jgi:CBS domain-containing protein
MRAAAFLRPRASIVVQDLQGRANPARGAALAGRDGMTEQVIVRLPLRLRTLVQDRGPDDVRPSVRCPRLGRSIDALGCTGCARMRGIEWDPAVGGTITCQVDASSVPASPPADRKADFAEAAARKELYDVASPVTVCVASTTPVRKVRALLLARELDAVPVVDQEMRVVGIVTRGDLLTAALDAPIELVTPPELHALPEHAPIGYAIALMAFEKVHHVPVITEEGELVGMWDATSALRWTAERMGYVAQ